MPTERNACTDPSRSISNCSLLELVALQLPVSPFQVIEWSSVPATEHAGETGVAKWRTIHIGDVRVRHVEYSAGYVADHWCDRGHILLVLDGELVTELRDGRTFRLSQGMTYQVSDFGDAAHRSSSESGASLFIVD
jgi:hypothetical protein